MVTINVTREVLAVDLRTYGEDDLANRIPALSDEELQHIGGLAGELAVSPERMLLAKALSLAAVEVLEGKPRKLKRAVRRLKGVYPGR